MAEPDGGASARGSGATGRDPRSPVPPPRWTRLLLRAALLAWPRRRRRSDGPALLATCLALVAEARARGARAGAREALGEAAGLVRSGLGLRRHAASRLATGLAARLVAGLASDLRVAVRSLRRRPGFTAVAVLTLALGLGANGAVFGMVDRVLLRPPPYRAPDELVVVWNRLPGSDERIPVAGPDAAVFDERSATLAELAFATRGVDGSVETAAGAEHVRIAAVTPDLFRVLGVEPALGGGFAAERDEGRVSGPDVATSAVVLSDAAWRRLFGADVGVVGRTIRVNGVATRVAGVMPEAFRLETSPEAGVGSDVDVWLRLSVPLSAFHREDDRLLDQDSDNSGVVIGRLAPRATLAAARVEADRIAAELRSEVPAYAAAELGFDVRGLHSDATRHARGLLLALSAGVGAVLLVACLNLAALLVARGVERTREWSVRAALGAGRARLLRQLAVESTLLAGLGVLAALAVATLATRLLVGVVPEGMRAATPIGLDLREVVVVLALGAGASALFVLLSAAQVRGAGLALAPGRGLAPGGAAAARSRRALVVAEVALSVVLVLGAGLLLRTVEQLRTVRPGFETRGALTFRTAMRVPVRYRSPADRAELVRRIEDELAALPDVRAVGLVGALPLSGDRWTQPYGLPGQAESEWQANRADFRVATSGYLEALGARVLEGRSFTRAEDLDESERVVLVDEHLARRVAPGGSAVGRVLGVPVDGRPVAARIVGVVEHVRHRSLELEGRETIYVPYRQEASREVAFVVRTTGDPRALAPHVRAVVRAVDPQLPVYDVQTLGDYVDRAVGPRSFALVLLAAFAGLGLLCSAVGLYGVVAFEVRHRTRELGVRMAVGARPERVLGSVLADGLRLGGWGLLLGGLLGAGFVRALGALIYGVSAADPTTWTAVAVLVLGVTLLACAAPALRASRLDPSEALRAD